MVSWDQNPESNLTVTSPAGAGAADPGDGLVEEPADPALGVRLPLAHPSMEHLTGVGPGGEQRVIAELVGVTEPGTVFELPVDLADRGVDIDHQRQVPRPRTGRPRPAQGVADHGFHLPGVPERERPQERPDR